MPRQEFDPYQKAQIQGHRRINRTAPIYLVIAALFLDFAFGIFLFLASAWVVSHPLWPDISTFLLGVAVGSSQLILGVLIFKKSIGLSTFGLEVEQLWLPRFQQITSQTPIAIGTMLLMIGFICYLAFENISNHPVMVSGTEWKPKPYVPPGFERGQDLPDWNIIPLYYTLGAWPKTFNDQPIFMYLPYAKGPPTRFPEKILARWKMPNIFLTAEGPKTPRKEGRVISTEDIRKCVIHLSDYWKECLDVRNTVLGRHAEELLERGLKNWKLKWFRVDNPAVDSSDIPRGIYFSGENKFYVQERYIIFTASGKQQTFVLNRTQDPAGEHASELFEKSIRSLRVSYELQAGRALVNMRLSQTHVGNNKKIESPDFANQLAEVQSLLISKITVDPKDFQAYYHLGGTALMLAEHAAKLRKSTTKVLSEETLAKLNEWSAVSKPTVRNVYLYAKDMKPNSPQTKRLEHLWLEAQKY